MVCRIADGCGLAESAGIALKDVDCLLLSYDQTNEERFPWDKVALVFEYVPAPSGFVLPAEAQHCSRACFHVRFDIHRDGKGQWPTAISQLKDTGQDLIKLPTPMQTPFVAPNDRQRTGSFEQRRDLVDNELAASRRDRLPW